MKFRTQQLTANGFVIGKVYKATPHSGAEGWRVVDHTKIKTQHNIWQTTSLNKDSRYIFCYPMGSNYWTSHTVVRVDLESIIK